jgi:tetratricopeptide (TPR) repeat protein/DNA-binding CsgD family transcriptional regulator
MCKIKLIGVLVISFFLPPAGYCQSDHNPKPSSVQRPDNSAYNEIRTLLQKALLRHDSRVAAQCYQQIGDIFFKEGVMPQALEYYFKADEQFSPLGNQIDIADNMQKIGRVYFKNSKDALALTAFKKVAELSARHRHYLGVAEADKYIAQIYERRGDVSRAHQHFELALQAYLKLNNHQQAAFTYAKIGGIYEDEGRYLEALSFFFKSLELYHRTGQRGVAGVLNNVGDTFRKMNDYRNALKYTKQAEILSFKLKDRQQLSSAQRDLAKVYAQTGKFDSAYYYSEKARAAYAKSFNTESDKKLNLLQSLFEVQKKNAEIVRLGNDKQVNRILSMSASLIALLVGFLSYSVVSRQRLRSKAEKTIYQQQSKSMELELINKELKEETLKAQLELQSKELSSHTLLIIQKNQFLEALKQKVAALIKDDKRDQRKELKQLIALIDENSDQDKNWEDFRIIYENIHENFFEKLTANAPLLTPTDLRFLALLKMNMEPADVATMLGISLNSLRTTRYRVKKKLRLSESESLSAFVQQI